MKKNYELKFDWVKSEKIDKVGLVTLNHENSLNPSLCRLCRGYLSFM